MYDLLELYAMPYCEKEPVVCVDEKSKQLLQQTRTPIAARPGKPMKEDYEYRRAGTRNIFMAVEPKGGQRQAEVTARRTKSDFHLVMDNLNTHLRSSFEEILGDERAEQMLKRVKFHYTPKHASWLNMAEIEIGIMDRQCTGGRLTSEAPPQSSPGPNRVEVHPTRCRLKTIQALCIVIKVLRY